MINRSSTDSQVVVIGAGVIGLSIAWNLSRLAELGGGATDPGSGTTRIIVIDPDFELHSGASWVAGGMLAPVAEAHQTEPDLIALGMASAARWQGFAEELADAIGTDGHRARHTPNGGTAGFTAGGTAGEDTQHDAELVGLTRNGTLVVARDADDATELGVLHDVQRRFGGMVERLTSRQARAKEPALASTIRGALWLPDDHQIDNRLLLQALRRACERSPHIELREGLVTSIVARGSDSEAESSVAVRLDDGGVVPASSAVICNGAYSGRLAIYLAGGSLVPPLPVRPVKGQIVRVQAIASAVMPTRTVRGAEVYVIPRSHGEIAIGATTEELGFDTRVTAGAVRELLDRAWELLPGLAEATFVEATAGLRPGTPDNLPIIGEVAPGVIAAAGHHRNGVLLAPITADLVASMLGCQTGGDGAPEVVRELAAFASVVSPQRFDPAPDSVVDPERPPLVNVAHRPAVPPRHALSAGAAS